VVGRERPNFARVISWQHRFWSMNDRIIQVDADSQPRKWRDGRDPHGAGA